MSGWIKFEKDLEDDPRVKTMARHLRNADITHGRYATARDVFPVSDYIAKVLGGLAKLWFYADRHIRDDNTIPLGVDDINEIIGIENFAQFTPEQWLVVLDAETVELPDFITHNGPDAKKNALGAKRQAKHRERVALKSDSDEGSSNSSSVTSALPDKTRQDKTRQDYVQSARAADPCETEPEIRNAMLGIQVKYPKAAREDWITAEKNARRLVSNGEATWVILQAGTDRYAKHCKATNRISLNPSRFFGDVDRPWSQEWPIPAKPDRRQPAPNHDAAWAEAKARAKAIGFRAPDPTETAAGYMTQVKLAEDRPPARTVDVSGLTAKLRLAQ